MESRKISKYIISFFVVAALSLGLMMSVVTADGAIPGASAWLLVLPSPLMFLCLLCFDNCVLWPRILLRGKYGRYIFAVFTSSYVAACLAIMADIALAESVLFSKHPYGMLSVWPFVEGLSDGIFFALVVFALAIGRLSARWRRESETLAECAARLENYVKAVRRRLEPAKILRCLDEACHLCGKNEDEANRKIGELSDYLRRELYELPPLPEIPDAGPLAREAEPRSVKFLYRRKYRILRHALLILVIMLIAANSGLNYPSLQNGSEGVFIAVVAMFLFLVVLIEPVIWRFRHFALKHLSMRRYGVEVMCYACVFLVPMQIAQCAVYMSMENFDSTWRVMMCVSSALNMFIVFFLYIIGIIGLLTLGELLRHQRRSSMLKFESVRQEYIFLKKHVNPHFLFNVLNNVSFALKRDSALARSTLLKLRGMVRYLFEEQDKDSIPLSEEIRFLQSYLFLEQTRREGLKCTLKTDGTHPGARVPTLMFIPFVENAVKYAATAGRSGRVNITFVCDGRQVVFRCDNTFCPQRAAALNHGMLGVSNTIRRMNLMFEDKYTYIVNASEGEYKLQIIFPCL